MAEPVSLKNTKQEILEAYRKMEKKVRDEKENDPRIELKFKEEETIVQQASDTTVNGIVAELSTLKQNVAQTIEEIGDKLTAEVKKLDTVKQAISVVEKQLEGTYDIKRNADSLTALILAQQEKKKQFEEEMTREREEFETDISEKSVQWQKDKERWEQEREEYKKQVERDRKREQDEYRYTFELMKKKDRDGYEAEKAALEKEITDRRETFEKEMGERERTICTKEQEFLELRKKVDAFPLELTTAVESAKKEVSDKLEFIHSHNAELVKKEIDGERKLYQQTIAALQAKIKEQEELIRVYVQKVNESNKQVEMIAIKAIESSSTNPIFVGRGGYGEAETVQKRETK